MRRFSGFVLAGLLLSGPVRADFKSLGSESKPAAQLPSATRTAGRSQRIANRHAEHHPNVGLNYGGDFNEFIHAVAVQSEVLDKTHWKNVTLITGHGNPKGHVWAKTPDTAEGWLEVGPTLIADAQKLPTHRNGLTILKVCNFTGKLYHGFVRDLQKARPHEYIAYPENFAYGGGTVGSFAKDGVTPMGWTLHKPLSKGGGIVKFLSRKR